jgi:cytochrome oxidase assembly protein ShyY1
VLVSLLRPKYWPGHLAMLVCLAIAGGLGLWQMSAWHQHRAAAERNLVNQPAKPLASVMTGDSPFPGDAVGQPVSFSGRWLGSNLYVANREQDGRRGYWVVTALLVDGSSSAMPVVRGWWPKTDLPAPTGTATVTGWLQASEGNDEIDADPHDNVIPTMRIASLVEHVSADLYSGYVVAKRIAGQAGLTYVDPPSTPGVSAFTGARNLFYAIEWWLFGGFAVFIWGRWCRDSLLPVEEEQPEPSDA